MEKKKRFIHITNKCGWIVSTKITVECRNTKFAFIPAPPSEDVERTKKLLRKALNNAE